jgi:glycerol kinase
MADEPLARSRREPLAAAIDLGSTWIKTGVLEPGQSISVVDRSPAPALHGDAEVREGDAASYVAAAARVVERLTRIVPRGTPFGVTAQRSSFLLWDRASGLPLTPLVSWQDRRGAEWCNRHRHLSEVVTRRTGLVLSGHYVGPKLAALGERDEAWRALLDDERTLFGTLDCYLTWRLSDARIHEIDRTMAARTSLLDLSSGDWSDDLLALFGVPRRILPPVMPTAGRRGTIADRLSLRVTIADQAAGALALFGVREDVIAVVLGTGAFVLRPTEGGRPAAAGYLTAPILTRADGRTTYALEGPINGGATVVDRFGPGPAALPRTDPAPDAFCLPDVAGLGAPFWRPEIGLCWSAATEVLDAPGRRRVVLEGLLFRVRQVVEDLWRCGGVGDVVLAGGLAREPFVGAGLAALLDRPIETLEVHEAALLATARLAAGSPPCAEPATRRIVPGPDGQYLHSKYARWKDWLAGLL